MRNSDLDRQLIEYENEIIRLEKDNCNLRVSLGRADSEAGSLRNEANMFNQRSRKSVPVNKKRSLANLKLQPLSS